MSKSSTLSTHLYRNIDYLNAAMTKGSKGFANAAVTDISVIISNSEELAKAYYGKLPYYARVNQLLTEAHKQRGRYLMELKQPEKALADFTAAITYNETYANQYDPALSKEDHTSPDYQSAYELRSACYAALGRKAEAAADRQTIFDLYSSQPYLPKLADFKPNWVSDSEVEEALRTRKSPSPEPQPQSPRSAADNMQDVADAPPSPSFAALLSPTNRLQDILLQGSASRSPSPDFLRSPSPGIQR